MLSHHILLFRFVTNVLYIRYWQLEAFGGISDIDTSLVTVFQMLLEKDHGKNLLPPRRMLDIKNTAEALMVRLL